LLALAAAALWAAGWISGTPGEQETAGLRLAYVGPGAGFAFIGSFLTFLTGFLLAGASLLLWPFRTLRRSLRRRKGFRRASIRRLIFLGLDGLDPELTERFIAEGKLPNLARLMKEGSYRRLRTTFPALSPVAWSTFATGVSPARHNIFDFLNRNLKSYLPELSSARVRGPRRVLRLKRLRIPLSRPSAELRRKSRSFWQILGDHGVGCTVLRVPITFPPEKFDGRLLSAMCTPDLKGTQGSFSQFTTRVETATFESGSRYPLKRNGAGLEGEIEGPEDVFLEGGGTLRVPFRVTPRNGSGPALLRIQDETHELKPGEYTPWIRIAFRTALGVKVRGIARFLLTETDPHFSIYASPVNLDPESPALPISHPPYYAAYLASLLGPYATLGMAEDTWALNEGVIDDEAFLRQAYLTFEEREAMFLSALETTRRGVVACVFDTSDRVQHMFYRYLNGTKGPHAGAIEEMYGRMDALAGKAMAAADQETVLFVLSDHGFCAFRRGLNLNSWLHRNGYLALQDGRCESGPYFAGVDWSRTKAYALGLAGLYLNVKGREAHGSVDPGAEAEALRQELIEKLSALRDDETGGTPVRTVYSTRALYQGPYLDAAPDLIVGYNDGYRISWEAATGRVTPHVIEDNRKAWSGDHCVDPLLVPGVLFSNRKIESADPGIEDLAPTALELFGVRPPAWMEGKPVFRSRGI
jgi:predicted AlkP superfamily phosphohydrolase/phosphomutase